jgi:hypothetical protein
MCEEGGEWQGSGNSGGGCWQQCVYVGGGAAVQRGLRLSGWMGSWMKRLEARWWWESAGMCRGDPEGGGHWGGAGQSMRSQLNRGACAARLCWMSAGKREGWSCLWAVGSEHSEIIFPLCSACCMTGVGRLCVLLSVFAGVCWPEQNSPSI